MTRNDLKTLQQIMRELENVNEEEQCIYYSDLLSVKIVESEKITTIHFTKKVEQAIRAYIISIIANKEVDYRIKNELLVTFLKF